MGGGAWSGGRRFPNIVLVLLVGGIVSGCGHRVPAPDQIARSGNLTSEVITVGDTLIQTYWRHPDVSRGRDTPLILFIEGDGAAWQSRRVPPADPTPREPVALGMAAASQQPVVGYLARPCQFVSSLTCRPIDWTSGRFSSRLIEALAGAADTLQSRTGSSRLIMVGYSGGAFVARLLSDRLSDVVGVVSVAGVLDHRFWTDFHGVTPLSESLNVSPGRKTTLFPVVALAGKEDRVVPPLLAETMLQEWHLSVGAYLISIEDVGHGWEWVDFWRNNEINILRYFEM